MATPNRLTRFKVLLPLIGVILFIYIVNRIGADKIVDALGEINPILFVLSLSLFIPRIIMSTYVWKRVATVQGINVSMPVLIKLNMIGLFYGTVTPLWLGDYIRVPYLHEESNEPLGKCASSVTIDLLIEFVSLFILALIGSVVLIKSFPSLFFIFFSVFVVIISVIVFLKEKKRSEKLFRIVYRLLIPERLRPSMENEFNAFYRDMPPLKSLVIPLLIGIASYTLYFIQIYVVALSFSIKIPVTTFILIYSVAALIGLIPITVSGLGTREAALIHIFSIYGIPSNIAVAISLSGYIITMLIPSMVGGILSMTGSRRR